MAVSAVVASLSIGFLPAAASSPKAEVALTTLGATSVSQGSPFRFKASVHNLTTETVVLGLVFELTGPPGASDPVRFLEWQATVPPSGTASLRPQVTSSQWFPDLGTFRVTALINGSLVAGPIAYEITAPTVAVPVFEDATQAAGLATTLASSQCGEYAAGAAWGDVDGDGDLDLFVPSDTSTSQLWINDGAGQFTDQAGARGVTNDGAYGAGAVFGDYDNDGDQDLFVANDGPDRLYRNDGTGHFTDVAPAAGVAATSADVSGAWGDYDNDGYLDLYITSNSPCLPPVFYEQDRLYHNQGDGTFTDQTSLLPAASTFGAGFQAAWLDYDGDGDQDLYLANDMWGPDRDPNHLWRNDGAGVGGQWTFTDVSAESGTGYAINSMGIGLADFDHDLDLDFAISNIEGNVLARNNGDGTFTDVADQARMARPFQREGLHSITWGLGFFDYNLDGWEDLYVAAGSTIDTPNQPNQLFTSAGANGTFLDLSALSGTDDPGSSRGVAFADYDRDGLVDMFVVNKNGSAHLFRNITATPGAHWLEVDLTGRRSSRDGCGARMILTVGQARLLRVVSCGSTSLSSGSDTVVHFGLGGESQATKLVIDWPSGVRQVVRNLAADRVIDVVEGR